MSLSVSVFVKQWPFITGLDGSLSDNTITSSGEGGCRSFLTSLKEETINAYYSTQNCPSLLNAYKKKKLQLQSSSSLISFPENGAIYNQEHFPLNYGD